MLDYHNLRLPKSDQKQPTNLAKLLRALLFAVTAVAISACGSLPTLNGEPSSDYSEQSEPTQQIGTNGRLIPIQSDNVRAAGYDEASMVMTVQFDNGALYEYYGVPSDLWTSFIAAQPHPWSQVGYPRLVQGTIPSKRIG